MPITLPCPTNESLTVFTPDTIHSDYSHNTPHQSLLLNDLALLDGIESYNTALQNSISNLSSDFTSYTDDSNVLINSIFYF